MTDRELMQQALDALEISCYGQHPPAPEAMTAMKSIRAELDRPQAEPVMWAVTVNEKFHGHFCATSCAGAEGIRDNLIKQTAPCDRLPMAIVALFDRIPVKPLGGGEVTRPPLPKLDGWAGRDFYHRPATTLLDINDFTPEQARYTASQMHAYADICADAALASMADAEAVPQKERPDFVAGYDAGMADAKRMQAAQIAEQLPQAVPDKRDVRLFNEGYALGHHDTVEAQYTHIHPSDMDSYHSEVVAESIHDDAAAPQAKPSVRKPLTDAQIIDTMYAEGGCRENNELDHISFARAIIKRAMP